MIIKLSTITLFVVILKFVTARYTCAVQKTKFADDRNAEWYPANCSTHVQPRRARCYLVCKDGFTFTQNASMFVDCIETKHSAYWSSKVMSKCISSTVCPKIQSELLFETGKGVSCNSNSVNIGMVCELLPGQCTKDRLIGPSILRCQENGTWTEGGTYCRAAPDPTSITCPLLSLPISTDPHQPDVDARKFLPLPILNNLNPSQLHETNVSKLSTGNHIITYTVTGSQKEYSCNVLLSVQDKEKPRPIECVEEQERIIFDGQSSVYISQGNYTFVDNEGNVTLKFESVYPSTVNFKAGVYKLSYTAVDSHGNRASCKVTYTVHGKECVEKYPSWNVNITRLSSTGYVANCKSQAYRSYTDVSVTYPFQKHFQLSANFRTCDVSGRFLKMPPILDCYKIQKKTGVNCPNGSVASNSQNECAPCPRGFRYVNSNLGFICELCPDNTTTFQHGSSFCVPCPGASWAIGDAPRRCQAHCDPGFVYTSMGCKLCPTNFFASLGATNCSACPSDMITLVEKASSSKDCVWGKMLDSSGIHVKIVKTSSTSYYLKFNQSGLPSNQLKQRFAVKIKSKYLSKQTDCENNYVQFKGDFEGFTTKLTGKLCGNMLDKVYSIKVREWRQTYLQYVYTDVSKADLELSYGLASCEPGQYFNLSTNTCEDCPEHTFQDKYGAIECNKCPVNQTTYIPGQSFCVAMCPPGFKSVKMNCEPCPMNFFGKDGQCFPCKSGTATERSQALTCKQACSYGEFLNGTKCTQCPVGQYQPLNVHSQSHCRYCVKGTTLFVGSKSRNDCITTCHYEGEYYEVKSSTCKPCPIGTYKYASSFTVSSCMNCSVNMTTKQIGSVRSSDCTKKNPKDYCMTNDPCVFPGKCQSIENRAACICPRYFTGVRCETVSGPCSTSPCQNNATCHPLFNKEQHYACQCEPGFVGENCEKEYHKCDDNPCWRANCTKVGQDFNCSCPPYTTGKTCRKALPRPCDNKTLCIHGHCDDKPENVGMNNYTCDCNVGYEGKACDRAIQFCTIKPCNSTGTKECNQGRLGRDCVCKPGFHGDACSQFRYCPAGSFVFRKSCCSCWQGYYSSEENINNECKKCPDGTTTLLRRTVNRSDCKDFRNLRRIKVKILLEGTVWQKNVDVTTCGLSQEHMESQLISAIGRFDGLKAVVVTEQYPPPKSAKNGMVLEFIIYGGDDEIIKQLETKVKTGFLGSLRVDKDYIKYEDIIEKETKKQKKVVVYIIIVVLVLVAIALIAGVFIWKRKNKTAHADVMFTKNDDVVHVKTPLKS